LTRAVLIFDLDDTLLRSFPNYAATHQRVARELGWPVPTIERLVPYAHDWESTLTGIFPGRHLEPFFRRYEEIAHEHPYEEVPGARVTLAELRNRGHRLYVVTKRDRSRLAARLREASIDPTVFDGIFPREEQPAPKPDPRCFAPVWAALGSSPRALESLPIYVGDRNEDRMAATDAGIRFVAVRTGPEVSLGFPHGHDAVIDSIAELPGWLDADPRARS
jgi:phosphoglycolate phosphatase-like HAD superfamily hydrolase